MQAVGNDFVLIDARRAPVRDWSEFARCVCARPFGVGSDGLLFLERGASEALRMRMWNPDGSEDFCGNGLRCATHYAALVGLVELGEFCIETIAGVVRASVAIEGSRVGEITLDIGWPRFAAEEIPTLASIERPAAEFSLLAGDRSYRAVSLSTGSTHTVIFAPELPDDDEFQRASPQIEHHILFPERTNVMWVRVDSPAELTMRIWERGAGETLGCGSGACAAAVAARLRRGADETIVVRSKGGASRVRWSPGQSMKLIGEAHMVFEGVLPTPT